MTWRDMMGYSAAERYTVYVVWLIMIPSQRQIIIKINMLQVRVYCDVNVCLMPQQGFTALSIERNIQSSKC